jgi:hypothetical protein
MNEHQSGGEKKKAVGENRKVRCITVSIANITLYRRFRFQKVESRTHICE